GQKFLHLYHAITASDATLQALSKLSPDGHNCGTHHLHLAGRERRYELLPEVGPLGSLDVKKVARNWIILLVIVHATIVKVGKVTHEHILHKVQLQGQCDRIGEEVDTSEPTSRWFHLVVEFCHQLGRMHPSADALNVAERKSWLHVRYTPVCPERVLPADIPERGCDGQQQQIDPHLALDYFLDAAAYYVEVDEIGD
uniref:Uncharacterized protein n=1 Tax=Anopheles christyi TaxID=43041 RepID=A0A182KIE4_9DIPT